MGLGLCTCMQCWDLICGAWIISECLSDVVSLAVRQTTFKFYRALTYCGRDITVNCFLVSACRNP